MIGMCGTMMLAALLCAQLAWGATITRVHNTYTGTSGGFQLKIGGTGFGSALAPLTVTIAPSAGGRAPSCLTTLLHHLHAMIVCETPPAGGAALCCDLRAES